MKVLGIETATQVCSTALVENETLISEYRLNLKNVHAGKLPVLIKNMLNDIKISVQDIDAIAVSAGPGSFTGLRIGISVAKGISLAHNIPIIPVSTMDALVFQVPVKDGTICSTIKAKANEYYTAIYKRNNFIDNMIENITIKSDEEIFNATPENTIIFGDITTNTKLKLPDQFVYLKNRQIYANSYTIALLGSKNSKYDTLNSDTFEPTYYQEFIAVKPKTA